MGERRVSQPALLLPTPVHENLIQRCALGPNFELDTDVHLASALLAARAGSTDPQRRASLVSRDWLSLWESLRRLHLLCARGGSGSGGGEAKLRADVALQSMHMARAALPTLLRGRS